MIELENEIYKTASKVSKSIDRHLTLRNWLIGHYIITYEQKGEDRAAYGQEVLARLAEKLDTKGLSLRSLKLFRQFYEAYPIIGQTASAFLKEEQIGQTASAQFIEITGTIDKPEENSSYQLSSKKLINHLSFSHFVELMKIKDSLKRSYYEIEAIKGVWSVRELKRQINSLSYERSASAENFSAIQDQLYSKAEKLEAKQLIKNPYVFDFLNLPDSALDSESELENALISELKNFILELGHGFCFEAQQKRIIIGGDYFFIDLLFYHRILKCHIIIELKVDAFSHEHAGQLNTYLQYFKRTIQQENDNPPIGILLCTNKNEELVEFALGGMDENLFVSQYKTVLPSTEEFQRFLKAEKEKLK